MRDNQNKWVKVNVRQRLVSDYKKSSNFIFALHEINWRQYLPAEDTSNLFRAYDDLLVYLFNGSHGEPKPVNNFKNMTIKCFYAKIFDNTRDDVSSRSYKHDVNLSKTEFKEVDSNLLISIINAVPSIGNITFDYSNVNWQASEADFVFLKAHYWKLRRAVKSEYVKFSMAPHDFYEIAKCYNFSKILSQVRLYDFLPMDDMTNLCLAFDYLIDSNCCGFKWTFEIWKRKNRQLPLSEIHVIFNNFSNYKIVGNNNFFFKTKSDNEAMDALFQYFGPEIRKIRISNHRSLFIVNRDINGKHPWFTRIRDVISENCKNLEYVEVNFSDEDLDMLSDMNWNGLPINLKPVMFYRDDITMCRSDAEVEIITHLQIRHPIIETIELKPHQRHSITECIFEMILKLPRLTKLKFDVPLEKISNWKYLENIKCFNQKTILPKLLTLDIANCQNEQPYRIEEFFNSLSKISSLGLQITKLILTQCHIQRTTFRLIQIKELQSLELINCTIDHDVSLTAEFMLVELILRDMEAPLWIFKELYSVEKMTLMNCPNIKDAELEIIMSRVPKLEELCIVNCPITDAFFYYMLSQTNQSDHFARNINLPIKFQLYDMPQCSPRVSNFFFERMYWITLDTLYPRMVKTNDFIKIIQHPYIEKIYHPDPTLFSTTFDQFFNASGTEESSIFSFWNQRFPKLFDTIIIRKHLGFIQIIGENNFVIALGVQSRDVYDKMRKLFRCFGCTMQSIQIFHVSDTFQIGVRYYEEMPFFKMILNTIIEPNCKNVKYIKCGSRTLATDLCKHCPILKTVRYVERRDDHFKIHNFSDELSLIRELQGNNYIVSELNLENNYDGITERAIETIFKLEWIDTIALSTSYTNIPNWNFLQSIKCTEHERILPRVQFISISSRSDRPSSPVALENFFINFRKLDKCTMDRIELRLHRFDLTSTTLNRCCFVTEVILLSECNVARDVNINNLRCFKNIKAVKCINMEVPISFLETTNPAKTCNTIYLELTQCPNINDTQLEAIMASSSAIKSVSVRICPISQDFFEKRPHIRGDIDDRSEY